MMAAKCAWFIYLLFDGKSSGFHALLLQTMFIGFCGFFLYIYVTVFAG